MELMLAWPIIPRMLEKHFAILWQSLGKFSFLWMLLPILLNIDELFLVTWCNTTSGQGQIVYTNLSYFCIVGQGK